MSESARRSSFSQQTIYRRILLIVATTAFVLAFPFAMSILWFPEIMVGVYLGATAIVSGVIAMIYVFVQSEKARSADLVRNAARFTPYKLFRVLRRAKR